MYCRAASKFLRESVPKVATAEQKAEWRRLDEVTTSNLLAIVRGLYEKEAL